MYGCPPCYVFNIEDKACPHRCLLDLLVHTPAQSVYALYISSFYCHSDDRQTGAQFDMGDECQDGRPICQGKRQHRRVGVGIDDVSHWYKYSDDS